MQHPAWPISLVVFCAAIFWSAWRAEEPDPPRSLESVITLTSSIVRDVQSPLRMALESAISIDEEMRVGGRLARPFLANAITDTDDQRSLERVGQAVARGVRRDEMRYHFVLLAEQEAHAFAICGGWVFVTRGMMDACENDAELAGVLGHEIAHIDLGHTADIVWREKLDDPTGLVDVALRVARLGYSEELEREADIRGVLLAEKAAYHPSAILDLFIRLDDARTRALRDGREGVGGVLERSLEAYLATHPSFARRIETIEAVIEENRSTWRGKRYELGGGETREFR